MHDDATESSTRSDVDAGLVLKWRRRGDTLEGLLCRERADGMLLTEWLPALVFQPLDSTTG